MVVRSKTKKGLLLFEATMDGVDIFRLDLRLDFYRYTRVLESLC